LTNTTAEPPAKPSANPSANPSSEPSKPKKSNAGVIAGSVIGVLIGVALLVGSLYFCLHHRVARSAGVHHNGEGAPIQAELGDEQVFEKDVPASELPASLTFYHELPAAGKPPELEGD